MFHSGIRSGNAADLYSVVRGRNQLQFRRIPVRPPFIDIITDHRLPFLDLGLPYSENWLIEHMFMLLRRAFGSPDEKYNVSSVSQ